MRYVGVIETVKRGGGYLSYLGWKGDVVVSEDDAKRFDTKSEAEKALKLVKKEMRDANMYSMKI